MPSVLTNSFVNKNCSAESRRALQKLLSVYLDYCAKCYERSMSLSDHFEAIPCGMLMLYCDKDCRDFGYIQGSSQTLSSYFILIYILFYETLRPQYMVHMLAEDFFLNYISIGERTRHWIFFASLIHISQHLMKKHQTLFYLINRVVLLYIFKPRGWKNGLLTIFPVFRLQNELKLKSSAL